jgi:hypothetical protein
MTSTHRHAHLTTGGAMFRKPPNPRGCPGSFARVGGRTGEYGVCPFCNADKKIRKDGTLMAHARPK